jgi:hypothetical protein
VALVNVACGTEGVVIMQVAVSGGASAPTAVLCSKQESITPPGDSCEYSVLDATQPKSSGAAQAAALALGKRLVTFGSQAEFDAVRSAITSSYAYALLTSGALAGLWVDADSSAYLPPGYSLPASGQASLLAGAALALNNVPAATTVAGSVLEKCAEVDSSIGEGGLQCCKERLRALHPCACALPGPRACWVLSTMHVCLGHRHLAPLLAAVTRTGACCCPRRDLRAAHQARQPRRQHHVVCTPGSQCHQRPGRPRHMHCGSGSG